MAASPGEPDPLGTKSSPNRALGPPCPAPPRCRDGRGGRGAVPAAPTGAGAGAGHLPGRLCFRFAAAVGKFEERQ